MKFTDEFTYPAPATGNERSYWEHIVDAANRSANNDCEGMIESLNRAESIGRVPLFLRDIMREGVEYDSDYWYSNPGKDES